MLCVFCGGVFVVVYFLPWVLLVTSKLADQKLSPYLSVITAAQLLAVPVVSGTSLLLAK